jgi:hypothetical protein
MELKLGPQLQLRQLTLVFELADTASRCRYHSQPKILPQDAQGLPCRTKPTHAQLL